MLKRSTCSSHGRLRSSVFLLPLTVSRPYAGLANGLTQTTVKNYVYPNSRCFVSTQQNSIDSVWNPLPANDDGHSTQRKPAKEDTEASTEDGNKSTVIITPRFQWNWRWYYPRDKWSKKRVGKQDGQIVDQKRLRNGEGTGHFSPMRGKRQEKALQSVIGALDIMSEELHVPFSPLERRIEDGQWEPKRKPTKEERVKLSFNPWAMMLAGKLRTDAASKVRFPDPLLLEMGPVIDTTDDSNYMMPDDLAALEEFDERLQRGLRRLAMINLHRERGGGTINILPDKTMMEELTDEFVTWQSSTQSGRTKNGVVMKRLLPPRWIERTQKLNAYRTASSDYWRVKEKREELNDRLFQKPGQLPDLIALKWQPDIAGRILSLMRQRLLFSIDHLGRKTDMPLNIPRRHFLCFGWPEPLHIDITSTLIDLEKKYSISELHHHPPREADNPESDHPGLQAWKSSPSAYHFSDPGIWIPGSYFLHVGPPEEMFSALPYSKQYQSSSTDGPKIHADISKFIPPMISVSNGYRLPVFNLQALLGPDFDHPLHQILAQHNMVQKTHDGPGSKGYLVLIRGTAPGSHYIIQELWQLWRYLGGTDCLPTKSSQDFESSSEPPTLQQDKMNARKDTIKQYTMSESAWNRFYSFLPNVKRKESEV